MKFRSLNPQSPTTDLGSPAPFAQNMLALAFGRTHNLGILVVNDRSDARMSKREIAVLLTDGQHFHFRHLCETITWHVHAQRPVAASKSPRPRPRPRRSRTRP